MAIAIISRDFESNSWVPSPVPNESALVVYTIEGSGTYLAGGDPIDFSAEFKAVYGGWAAGSSSGVLAMIPFLNLDTVNSGTIRWWVTGAAAGAVFAELAAGAYPLTLGLRFAVFGRPVTHAS